MATNLRQALLEAVGLDSAGQKVRLFTAATIVLAEWQSLARQKLNTSKSAYLASVAIAEVTDKSAIIELAGDSAEGGAGAAKLAKMVEFGMGPSGIGSEGRYDIRAFALREGSASLKWGKKGPYLRVPFNVSPKVIKSQGGNKALRMARLLTATTSNSAEGGGAMASSTKWGKRLGPNLAPKLKSHHVADPLQGLVRLASSYSRGNDAPVVQTTGYRKWRTMSWAGQPWWHPGIKARHIGAEVGRRTPSLIKGVI